VPVPQVQGGLTSAQLAAGAVAPAAVSSTGSILGADGSPVSGGGKRNAVVTLPSGVATLTDALRTAIDKLQQSRANRHSIVVVDGDSTASGISSPGGPMLGAAQAIGRVLGEAGLKVNRTAWFGYGASNPGVQDPRVTQGAGITFTANSSIVGGGWFTIPNGVSTKLTFQCDAPVDRAILIYMTAGAGTTTGTITLDVGGSALFSASSATTNDTKVSSVITLGSKADLYAISVGKTVSTEEVRPLGVIAWNSADPGVSVIVNGGPGKTASGAVTNYGSSGYYSTNLYSPLGADLVLISNILNNLGGLATLSADYDKMITAAKTGGAGVVMFSGPQPAPAQTNYANYATVLQTCKDRAAAASVPYVSCEDFIGANPGTGNAWYIVDNVGHMTNAGYMRYFNEVGGVLADAIK
jgi:hypothetical protein